MSALPTPPTASPATRLRWALGDSLVARAAQPHPRPPRSPRSCIDVTLQPLMFVLLFAYVFGGAIAVPGGTLPRVPDGRDLRPDADLRRSWAPAVGDRRRPRRGRRRPLPLAADGALGRAWPAARSPSSSRPAIAHRRARRGRPRSSAGASTPSVARTPSPASRLLLLFAYAMIWARDPARPARARSPTRSQGVVFIVDLPADVRGQHVRPDRRPARRAAARSRTGTRSARSPPRCATLFGNPTGLPAHPAGRSSTRSRPRSRGASGSSRSARRWRSRATGAPRAEAALDELGARADEPRVDRHRPLGRLAEVEALAEVDAEVAHRLELADPLDPLGDDPRACTRGRTRRARRRAARRPAEYWIPAVSALSILAKSGLSASR